MFVVNTKRHYRSYQYSKGRLSWMQPLSMGITTTLRCSANFFFFFFPKKKTAQAGRKRGMQAYHGASWAYMSTPGSVTSHYQWDW